MQAIALELILWRAVWAISGLDYSSATHFHEQVLVGLSGPAADRASSDAQTSPADGRRSSHADVSHHDIPLWKPSDISAKMIGIIAVRRL